MNDVKEFGRRVEKMRAQRRLTTQELADRAGLSYQSLWRIARGQHKDPGVFTAARLASALQCSLDYLVGLYEDKDSELEPPARATAGRNTSQG